MEESGNIHTKLFGCRNMEVIVARNIRFWGFIAILMCLSGCTIIEAVHKNKEKENTLEIRQRELEELQGGIQKKKEINAKLLSQLQAELQELAKQLKEYDEIKKGNKKSLSGVEALKTRLADLDDQLGQLKNELVYGSDRQDEKALDEKKRQIEGLRKDIEAYLRLGSN